MVGLRGSRPLFLVSIEDTAYFLMRRTEVEESNSTTCAETPGLEKMERDEGPRCQNSV
jgi:hypothetical protein